VYYYTVNILPY